MEEKVMMKTLTHEELMKLDSKRKITLDAMKYYIENNCPERKADFKEAAIKDGKYKHLKAVKWFCDEFRPELNMPKPKTAKPSKAVRELEDW